MRLAKARRARWAAFALLGLVGLGAPAWGQSRTETISPDDSSRALSFDDWCQGIKGFGADRCAERRPEDQSGFRDSRRQLRAMGIGPRQSLGCDANAAVNPTRNWVGSQGCHPVNQPEPDRQPFNAPR